MPELPEIESVCKVMRAVVLDKKIESVVCGEDSIVFKGEKPETIEEELTGKTVHKIGRKGKYFWLEYRSGFLIGHLGMSGWVERLEREQESPRFTKLRLNTAHGSVAITDKRRLGRIWLAESAENDPTIQALGLDALGELPAKKEFQALLAKRKAPIKAVLLDQSTLSGIGNYLADEILYHAKINPKRLANSLSDTECGKLRDQIHGIIETAVDADADEEKFPISWLFHHRWGGKKGAEMIGEHKIVRETVGGRTTAWVPELQK